MIEISYSQIKEMIDAGLAFKYVIDSANNYVILVNDAGVKFSARVPILDPASTDQEEFEDFYAVHATKNLSEKSKSGDFKTYVTHNLCDSSTWPSINDSTWSMAPTPGYVMYVVGAELQFLHDVTLNGVTQVHFDVWVTNPVDPESKVLYERNTYSSIYNVMELGNSHFTMPAVDGFQHSFTTVQFNYPRSIGLKSSMGAEIRITLEGHVEVGGTYATVTFKTKEVAE